MRQATAPAATTETTMKAKETRKAGEPGEEALAPAITYAVVFGTTPSAVARRKGIQPQRDTAAQ